MICQINRKRLTAFTLNTQSYEGMNVGDMIVLPHNVNEPQSTDRLVIITGFIFAIGIVYWKSRRTNREGFIFVENVVSHSPIYKG